MSCRGVADPGVGPASATTPQKLVELLRDAEQKQRYGEAVELITPDQREAFVFIVWFGVAYDAITTDPQILADYRAIVSEHGLDEEWLSEDATGKDGIRRVASRALRGVDLPPLLDDLAAFQVEHGRFGVAFGFVGELRDLHVEDDWALARIDDSEFELVRGDDAWTWSPLPGLDR